MTKYTIVSSNYATGEGVQHCVMFCHASSQEKAIELFREKFGWPHYAMADVYTDYNIDLDIVKALVGERTMVSLKESNDMVEYYGEFYMNLS